MHKYIRVPEKKRLYFDLLEIVFGPDLTNEIYYDEILKIQRTIKQLAELTSLVLALNKSKKESSKYLSIFLDQESIRAKISHFSLNFLVDFVYTDYIIRVDICQDCCDQRLRKSFPGGNIFFRKQRKVLCYFM